MTLTDHEIKRIRKNGVIGRHGNLVKGNAALLRYLSVGEACDKIRNLDFYKLEKRSEKRSKKRKSA